MACSAYKLHVPRAPATDSHHVIPQAWQQHFVPGPGFLPPAGTPWASLPAEARKLWDPRTVELCPNCHRGVHERIVALMKGEKPGRDRLWPIAELALSRFILAGGSLDDLRAAKLFGQQ